MLTTTTLAPIEVHPGLSFRPVGANVHDGGVSFRVWAPSHASIRVVTGDGATTRYVPLEPETGDDQGFFSGRDDRGRPGDLYWFQLDQQLAPDPASRFQPNGVEGPAEVIDPRAFEWRARDWKR